MTLSWTAPRRGQRRALTGLLWVAVGVLGCPLAHAAAPPVIFFTDLESGPNTGGENHNGAFLTIYGKNFGPTPTVPSAARSAPVEVALSHSLGFGGHNATLALHAFRGYAYARCHHSSPEQALIHRLIRSFFSFSRKQLRDLYESLLKPRCSPCQPCGERLESGIVVLRR